MKNNSNVSTCQTAEFKCNHINRCKRFAVFRAFAYLCFFLLISSSFGQTETAPVSATITFGNGSSITVGSNDEQVFSPIDIFPGEAPNIQLQLPPSFVNTPVGIQSMDGGHAPDELLVAGDGSAAFVFQSGTQPGLYRIVLASASASVLLQFTVPNPGNP